MTAMLQVVFMVIGLAVLTFVLAFRVSAMQSILLAQEERWHGRNPECHKCHLSHEVINGTFCAKLHRYVEHGKGDCGVEAEVPPAPE